MEKCILINDKGNILFEKDFIQIDPQLKIPECGVVEYNIENIDTVKVNNKKILKVNIQEHYEICAGQKEKNNLNELLFSLDDYSLIRK